MSQKIAFFDIGTNSIHMKIVQANRDLSFEVLEHLKDMTRIGDGSFKSKKLSKPSVNRALKTISNFSAIAKKEGVKKFIAIATSAVRDAKNKPEFTKAVFKKTGIRVRVISGEEEGRLIYLGASSGMDKKNHKMLSLDVGGGSAEFTFGDHKKIDFVASLPLGVARLHDRFMRQDPPTDEEVENLEDYVEEKLSEILKNVRVQNYPVIVGTGGTMINLASMVYEASQHRRLRLRGYFNLKKKEIKNLSKKLLKIKSQKVKKMPGVDKKRADLMATGSIVILKILQCLGKNEILVSDKGIREGLILKYIVGGQKTRENLAATLPVQWFGQKPFFSGRILAPYANLRKKT